VICDEPRTDGTNRGPARPESLSPAGSSRPTGKPHLPWQRRPLQESKRPTKYAWILFDADDTLFHFDAFQGLRRMFARFQFDFSEQDYVRHPQINKPLWIDYQGGRISAEQLPTTRFEPWAVQRRRPRGCSAAD
jgi:putative hydrolase of the HAD superfamily